MRLGRSLVTSTGIWWQAIALLVALPALVLAALGLKAVRADRIEREQQTRDRQAQTARLADARIRSALSEIERELRRRDAHEQQAAPRLPQYATVRFFSFDPSRGLVFEDDRLYSGESPQRARSDWPASIEQLVEQARAAEAQQRASQAVSLYNRIGAVEPGLRDWARLSVLRIQHADLAGFLGELGTGPRSGDELRRYIHG